MLIINADDWGGWKSATDAALSCFEAGRITSATAMVFMEDSERAAHLARANSFAIGLHLNFNHEFTGTKCPRDIRTAHDRVRRYLRKSKLSQLLYNPFLRGEFRLLFQAQLDEFCRLYACRPTHFDGHQHMHLCANMVFDQIIPSGVCVRRNFSFQAGDKSALNRFYRSTIDAKLRKRHIMTDGFYSLEHCLEKNRVSDVVRLAEGGCVELMTHPERPAEKSWLMGDCLAGMLRDVSIGSYRELPRQRAA